MGGLMNRTAMLLLTLTLAGVQVAGAQGTPAQKDQAGAAATPVVTRGIGVYPGDPREDFSPTFRVDTTTYRNLAHLRPAYHSSSYDYNLTAQLVTDGIVDTAMPRRVVVASGQAGILSAEIRDLPQQMAQGPLGGLSRQQMVWPKYKREWPMDDNWVTGYDLTGPQVWVQFDLLGGSQPLVIDQVTALVRVQNARGGGPENWTCSVQVSEDGQSWTALGRDSGMSTFGGDIRRPELRRQPIDDLRCVLPRGLLVSHRVRRAAGRGRPYALAQLRRHQPQRRRLPQW